MRYFFYFLIFGLLVAGCSGKPDPGQAVVPDEILTYHGRTIKSFDFESFSPYLDKVNDTTYVINFWASWCKPCVKEIGYFEQIHKKYSGQKVKVLLVSLDFRNQVETKLVPFIKQRNLTAEVILLNDPDANSWIGKVDENWTGSIPATLVYNKDKRTFYEKAFTYEELETIVKSFI